MSKAKGEETKRTRYNEPMGLPKGTVRASITILVLVMFCLAIAIEMLYGSKVPDTLSAITLTVVAYYFGTRSAESQAAKDPVSPLGDI